jgi:putative oxidoreductase
MTFIQKLLATNAPAAVILIRLVVGAVFLVEGIQKFIYPDALGVGRFTKIGILAPEILAPFVGVRDGLRRSLPAWLPDPFRRHHHDN